MTMLMGIILLSLWALAACLVWSAMAIAVTATVLAIPAVLGHWRVVRLLSVTMLLLLALLWLSAWFGAYPNLALPSRPKAAIVLLPIVAIWPALAARFAHLRCPALRVG
ncbi:MAG: hypothetical protein ACK4IA_00435 [Paracoccus hibiscisoli]|uniref:hypothetical protein n=1 Tax=Paracoccus hibiscisoli TaxID=2023261 RepID=UPI00391B1D54